MNQFGLGQFLNKVIDYSLANLRGNSTEAKANSQMPTEGFDKNLPPSPPSPHAPVVIVNMAQARAIPFQTLQMNHLESLETALYVKDLLKLPKDMKELLKFIQEQTAATPETVELLTKNIDLNQIAVLLQQNGKEAISKLITAMSNASKQGITDLSQLKDLMKLINASVSVAGEKNPNQTLKSLMLLYLPWLPLQEGVGFDLEVESKNSEADDSDCTITIMISTKNYGNIRATLILMSDNAVNVVVSCSEEFPKEELLKRIKADEKSHSMQSNIVFEQMVNQQDENATRQAKISMSNSTKINPFLLLMAHSVIRHTIELDRLAG